MKGLRYITSTKGKKNPRFYHKGDINPIYGFLNDTKIHTKKNPNHKLCKN